MFRSKPGPLCKAAEEWLAQAFKGETYEYYRGPSIERVAMSAEQQLSPRERELYQKRRDKERAAATAEGRKPERIKLVDRYKTIRPDVMALAEKVDHWDITGLVASRVIILQNGVRAYQMTVLVQRNGLIGVRKRQGWSGAGGLK